jgi:hypothetical protein
MEIVSRRLPKPVERACPRRSTPEAKIRWNSKCGNPRLRWALGEAAWRLVKYQPQYRLCKKWRAQILDPKTLGGRTKQLIVALARGFGVDWWRICTGQTTPEKLGLVLTVNSAQPSTPD